MQMLVAIDSFKGSLSSYEAGKAVSRGIIHAGFPSCEICAVADGGEGSVDALMRHKQGKIQMFSCRNAFHQLTEVPVFLFTEDNELCAAVEAASIYGLHGQTVSYQTVEVTNTYGAGELIKLLVGSGVQKLLFFLGGTITSDAGLGMMQGLGVKLYDAHDHLIPATVNPLFSFHHWDEESYRQMRVAYSSLKIIVGCDVNAPLYGENGCIWLYSSQKGATPRQQELLERKLHELEAFSKQDLMKPGCGAGGGSGAGFLLAGAQLTSGFDLISSSLQLEERIRQADMIITGEGGMNAQSLQGKLPICVAEIAHRLQKPVIAFCGQKESGNEALSARFDGIFSIQQGVYSLKEAIDHTAEYLEESAYQYFRLIRHFSS